MAEILIIRSIISYTSRIHIAYRRGIEPRSLKTIYPIPDNVKVLLEEIVFQCKSDEILDELDALVQESDRVLIFIAAHKKAYQEFENGFTPLKFMKWFAVSVVIGAELVEKGFSKALDVLERDIFNTYKRYEMFNVFPSFGFCVG